MLSAAKGSRINLVFYTMTTKEIAELKRNAGLKIFRAHDTFFWKNNWINYTFPPVCKIPFNTIEQLRHLRWKHLITVIYSDARIKNTYEFILDTDQYSIECFDHKVRNQIRKSLKTCIFKRPELNDLLTSGLAINKQTLKRQNRRENLLTSAKLWEKYISAIYNHPDVIITSAYYEGKMIGYIIVYELQGKWIIENPYIDRQHAPVSSPMNGLIYSVVNQLIALKGKINISYGIESFVPLPELNRFKNKMLFKRISVSRLYLINPLALPFIKLALFFYIRLLNKHSIRNSFIRNAINLYQGYRLYDKVKSYPKS